MRVRSQLEPVLEKEKMGEDKIIVSEEGSWEEKKDPPKREGLGLRRTRSGAERRSWGGYCAPTCSTSDPPRV